MSDSDDSELGWNGPHFSPPGAFSSPASSVNVPDPPYNVDVQALRLAVLDSDWASGYALALELMRTNYFSGFSPLSAESMRSMGVEPLPPRTPISDDDWSELPRLLRPLANGLLFSARFDDAAHVYRFSGVAWERVADATQAAFDYRLAITARIRALETLNVELSLQSDEEIEEKNRPWFVEPGAIEAKEAEEEARESFMA